MDERRKHTFTEEDGVSLKEHLESRCDLRMESMDKAITLAKQALDTRLDQMNEIRSAMKEQASQYITRHEHDFLVSDIQSLKESRAELRGKASQTSVIIGYVFSFLGLLIATISLFHR